MANPTLTADQILFDVIDHFGKKFPALNRMGTDFSHDSLKLGKKYTAHTLGLPSSATYTAADGYANGAQAARDLLSDRDITINNHKHVPLKWLHLEAIRDDKIRYDKAISSCGYVLAKEVIDSLFGEFTAANYSKTAVHTVANSDLDMLDAVTEEMNQNGADPEGRCMFVNTPVASVLGADSRIASGDYHGQQTQGYGYRSWSNIGGFEMVMEYPDLPANGENLTCIAFEQRAFSLIAGPPEDAEAIANMVGAPITMPMTFVTDPATGLTMGAVSWQENGTGDVFFSPTLLWDSVHGKDGGAADEGTDAAGFRVTSA